MDFLTFSVLKTMVLYKSLFADKYRTTYHCEELGVGCDEL